MIITGAAAVGFTKLIKNGGAIMTRVASIRSCLGTLVSRTFQRTQASKAGVVDVAISREMLNAAATNPVVSSELQRLATPSQLDFFHLRGYTREMEGVSGLQITAQQRTQLFGALREKNYVKLSPAEKMAHSDPYRSKALRDSLIADWETHTGQKWPTYEKDLFDTAGRRVAEAGKQYQFHHIIPQQYGGPHAWWNGHPVPVPEHQTLTHSSKGTLYNIMKSLNE
jgi:predicted ribonuclease toxin of YeeF-YezG toxin-antitoxin module